MSEASPWRPWVEQLLGELLREAPAAVDAAATRLAASSVRIDVSEERFGVVSRSDGPGLCVTDAPSAPDCTVSLARATVIRLLRGQTRLLTAIESGELSLLGSPAVLQQARGAFIDLFHGALRAPSCHTIYRRFIESEGEQA